MSADQEHTDQLSSLIEKFRTPKSTTRTYLNSAAESLFISHTLKPLSYMPAVKLLVLKADLI